MAGEKKGLKEKFCPKCGSEEVMLEAGGVSGNYRCKKCSYLGIMPERELVDDKDTEGRNREKE